MQIAAHVCIWLFCINGAAHIAVDPVNGRIRSPRPCQTEGTVHTSVLRCNHTVIKNQSVGSICRCSRRAHVTALRMRFFVDKHDLTVLKQCSCVVARIDKINQSFNTALIKILVSRIHIQSILHTGNRHVDKSSSLGVTPQRVGRLVAFSVRRTIYIVVGKCNVFRREPDCRIGNKCSAPLGHISARFVSFIIRIQIRRIAVNTHTVLVLAQQGNVRALHHQSFLVIPRFDIDHLSLRVIRRNRIHRRLHCLVGRHTVYFRPVFSDVGGVHNLIIIGQINKTAGFTGHLSFAVRKQQLHGISSLFQRQIQKKRSACRHTLTGSLCSIYIGSKLTGAVHSSANGNIILEYRLIRALRKGNLCRFILMDISAGMTCGSHGPDSLGRIAGINQRCTAGSC